MCPSYPDSTWENGPDGIPLYHTTFVKVMLGGPVLVKRSELLPMEMEEEAQEEDILRRGIFRQKKRTLRL
ncbi:hypothetical protein GcM3_143014 [Golovinomyces cichoracearum]|uniref:Uncharacterized protein n=1 Tax=Golovinomyces cichoracearum TaxID=62708 RepID=A0A420HZR6_9PEZI|nr:hypothetical protein GcM3_143014 [Golovinomyces cichoracearum]